MIAIKRLQNILWILIVAFGALTAYLISLRVATERNAVQALERKIYAERAAIRYLETEFESRANMRQLEKWNAGDYRYVAPQAAQYLPDERALASLDRVPTNGDSYVAPPVMMAMVDSDADLPAAAAAKAPSPAPTQVVAPTLVKATPVKVAVAEKSAAPTKATAPAKSALRTASVGAPVDLLPASMKAKPEVRLLSAKAKDEPRGEPASRKAARVAFLDQKLLDDRTLRDLGSKAAAENHKGGR